MSGSNDNQPGARGRAVLSLIRWLQAGTVEDVSAMVDALELLDLQEPDVEVLCRHFNDDALPAATVSIPHLGRIS